MDTVSDSAELLIGDIITLAGDKGKRNAKSGDKGLEGFIHRISIKIVGPG